MTSRRDSIFTTLLMTILASIFCAPFLSFEILGQTAGHWVGVATASFYCALTAFWLRDKN